MNETRTIDMESAMKAAEASVRAGADVAARMFRTRIGREQKADGTFVTEADHAAEKAILDVLADAIPEASVFAEESGVKEGDPDLRWIVDPLDGTHRFARGGLFWGPLVALEQEGEIVVGALRLPMVDQTYVAAKGLGAWRDGERMRVSDARDWASSNLSLGATSRLLETPKREGVLRLIEAAEYTIAGGDLQGCAAVVSGFAEAWLEAGVQVWDIAPMKILVEEAGGRFTDLDGDPTVASGHALATNGVFHDAILATLNERAPAPGAL